MTTESSNVWKNILKDFSTGQTEKVEKNIIILGDEKDGKEQLVKYFQGENVIREIDEIRGTTGSFAFGMNYNYFNYKNETINMYEIEDTSFADFLDLVIKNPKDLQNTMAMITLDVTRIGKIVETLDKWAKKLESELERLTSKFDPKEVNDVRAKFKEKYEFKSKKGHVTITNNIGIPLVVVVTKCELIHKIAEQNHVNSNYDILINRGEGSKYFLNFLQYRLRKRIVEYGASMIYISTKDGYNNCQLLHNVIIDSFFNTAHVDQKDAKRKVSDAKAEKRKKVKTQLNTPLTKRHDSIYIPFRYDTKLNIADLEVEQLVKDPENTTFRSVVLKKKDESEGVSKSKLKNTKNPSFQKFLKMQNQLREWENKNKRNKSSSNTRRQMFMQVPKKKEVKRTNLLIKKRRKKGANSPRKVTEPKIDKVKTEEEKTVKKKTNLVDVKKKKKKMLLGKREKKKDFKIPSYGAKKRKSIRKKGTGNNIKGDGDRDEMEDFFTNMLNKLKTKK